MNRFVIADPARCIGCNTCMAACSMVHKAVGLQAQPRLTVERHAGRTAPMLCRQCEDAPCARVCPVNAISHGDDAIVLNETLCIGCKLCAIACPFGAITPGGTPCSGVVTTGLNYVAPGQLAATAAGTAASDSDVTLHPILASVAGVRSVAIKCDLCSFRSEGPECVRVCPTRAMSVVNRDALEGVSTSRREQAAAALDLGLGLSAGEEAK